MNRLTVKKWLWPAALILLLAGGGAVFFYYPTVLALLGEPTGIPDQTAPSVQLPFSEKIAPAVKVHQPAAKVVARSRSSAPGSNAGEQDDRGLSAAFLAWEKRAGYIRPKRYDFMSEEDLKRLSAAGDMYASQRLGEIALQTHRDLDAAIELHKTSAAQGSLAAIAQLENLFNPTLAASLPDVLPGLREFRGDAAEAYLWSRIAVMRGDSDAIVAVLEHARGLSEQQVLQIERNAINQYRLLEDRYRAVTGHGFNNDYIDPYDTPLGQLHYPLQGGG